MGYDLYIRGKDGKDLDTEDGYFRRSIFSMGPLRQALEDLGLGYWSVVPAWNNDATDEEAERFLADTYNECPGIALHKLTSNDGWHVTQLECASMLQLWERAGSPDHPEFREDFIPFITLAAAYDGFRVF